MTEVFSGDILRYQASLIRLLISCFRFGSDVVDKAKKTTQKCVLLKLQVYGVDGRESEPR